MASPYDLLRAASLANRTARMGDALISPAQPYSPMMPTDPYEQLRRVTDENRARRLGITTVDTQMGPRFIHDVDEPVRTGVGGALRGIARALEPLQLPQDTMFAVLAGAVDPNTTIAQRLSRMKLSNYLPGGEAPERPASGEEIFHLMGFNPTVSKWAGIGADLIVDPLVFGSYLRVAGKLSKVGELVTLGNKFDHYISPFGIATEINGLARRSKTISNFQDARMMRLFEALRNPESELFGIKRFGTKAAKAADMVLPRDMALRLRLGPEVGQGVFQAERMAAATGRRTQDEALQALHNAVFGADSDQSKKMVEMFMRDMGEQSAAFEANLMNLPAFIREVVETEVHTTATSQVGAGFMALAQPDKLRQPALKALAEDLHGALRGFGPEELGDSWAAALGEAFSANLEVVTAPVVARLSALAAKEGKRMGLATADVESLQRRTVLAYQNYLRDTITIDAKLGLHTSGYMFVADNVRNRVFELTGDTAQANEIWSRVLHAGLTGGRKGIAELREASTGIRIATPEGLATQDLERLLANRRSRLDAVADRLNGLAAAREADKAAAAAPGIRKAQAVAEATARRDAAVAEGTRVVTEHEAVMAAAKERFVRDAGYTQEQAARAIAERQAQLDVRLETLYGVRAEGVANQREFLLRGMEGIPERGVAYVHDLRELLARRLPPQVGQSKDTTALLKGLDRLDKAALRHGRALEALTAAEEPTFKMMNDLIKAEQSLALEFGRQGKYLTAIEEAARKYDARFAVGDFVSDASTIAGRMNAGAEARAAQVAAAKARHAATAQRGKDITAEATADVTRAQDAATAREARLKAERDAVVGDAAARVREARAGMAGARAEFKTSRTAANEAYRAQRQAVREEQAARKAVEAAERAAEGWPTPGSTQDLYRVASEAPYIPRTLRTRAQAVPFDGNNTTIEDILAARGWEGLKESKSIRSMTPAERLTLEGLVENPVTFGELLDGIADMQALDLGDYLEGLMNGHLRKSYGLFMDQGDFTQYVNRIQDGSIIMTNRVIDEANLVESMPGFAAEARMISEYHNHLKAAGGGHILRRDGIIQYLEAGGVDGRRINETMEALQRSLSTSPEYQRNIDILKEWRRDYAKPLEDNLNRPVAELGGPLPIRNAAAYKERVHLTEQATSILGEHAMASMSILEGTSYAGRTVRRQEFFQRVYELAQNNGYLKNGAFMDEFGVNYLPVGEGIGTMGGFGGKFVHPFLLKELQRAAAAPKDLIPAAFNRVRSLLTGGYLAAPSVLAANFFGGLYQGATYGINPIQYLRRMFEVLPDMLAAGRGEETALMRALRRHGDVEVSGLVSADFHKDFSRLLRTEAGFGPEGIRALFDKVTSWYEDFLQRPGIGRFRVKFAGLEGFQFTENWFKVAAFKEMTERLAREGIPSLAQKGGRVIPNAAQAEKIAAEFARNVVFDYSTLPTSLDFLKKTGLVLFPGFAYFLAGRTLSTAMKRPGVLAVSDRISEAFMNAGLPVDEQILAYLGMSPYLREDQGAPLPFSVRLGKGDNKQVSMIPMAQLVPTQTIWDGAFGGGLGANPWAESISQLGIWGPLVDIISALSTESGEAPITGKYGNRVFEPGAEGAERAANVFRFLYNTMAPSVIRKGLSQDYRGQWKGLIPAVGQAFASLGDKVPEDFLSGVYSVNERRSGRPDKAPIDDMIAAFLRTPQVVALEGPLAGVRSTLESERSDLNAQLASLQARFDRAKAAGETATAEALMERMRAARNEFDDKWREYTRFVRAYNARRLAQRKGGE